MTSKQKKIDELTREVTELTLSPLYSYRQENKYHPVIGEGSLDARIMFVGEAPGENEAKTGRPFAGTAGKVLDKLLDTIKLDRNNVYITNIVKDRPPGNRDPKEEEITLYAPFLLRQLQIIQPTVIATLGRYSMKFILETCSIPQAGETIGKNHGQVFESEASYGKIYLIPLYHPAAALYQPSTFEAMKKDFSLLATYSIY